MLGLAMGTCRGVWLSLLMTILVNAGEWEDTSTENQSTEWVETLTEEPDISSRSCATCTCYCVPPGTCNRGSNIDIRIVNTGSGCPSGTSVCCVPPPQPPPPSPSPSTHPWGGGGACGQRSLGPAPGERPAQGQAYFGEFPWQAMLLTADGRYAGSGALVGTRFVITAAHVLPSRDPSALRLRLGEWDVGASAAGKAPLQPVDVAVRRVTVCPDFDPNGLTCDVAVLEMAGDAPPPSVAPHIKVACLPASTASYAGAHCWVSGWGRDAFGPSGRWQRRQRSVDVQVLAGGECEARLRATRLGPSYALNMRSFLCAGGERGKDACTGDGGAPLVCLGANGWEVVGLVSWGVGCGDAGVPGVYVNVASFVPWISQQMRPPPSVGDPRREKFIFQ